MKIAVLFLLLCTSAFARLGDTTVRLVERFGAPKYTLDEQVFAQGKMMKIGDRMMFTQDDWNITCVIIDGRCAKVEYTKPGEWTEQQIETVLTTNSQGARWTKTSKPNTEKFRREWKRADGAVAVWSNGFSLVHPAYELAKTRAKDRAKGQAGVTPKI
jgi:hypothetical protein